MTSLAQFSFVELGPKRRNQKIDDAQTRQADQDHQLAEAKSESEGFTPWVSEPDEGTQPECLYTAEDLAKAVDEARRTAVAETEAELRQAMANAIEQRRCELIAGIGAQLEQQRSAFDDVLGTYALIARRLATVLAKTVIPRALEKYPLVDVTEVLKATLARLAAEPAIDVRFSPNEADIGKAILADITKDVGSSTDVTSTADPLVADGSVQIRWQGGRVDHGWEVLFAEAQDMIDHWLGDSSPSPSANDQTAGASQSVPDVSSDDAGPVNDSSLETE